MELIIDSNTYLMKETLSLKLGQVAFYNVTAFMISQSKLKALGFLSSSYVQFSALQCPKDNFCVTNLSEQYLHVFVNLLFGEIH